MPDGRLQQSACVLGETNAGPDPTRIDIAASTDTGPPVNTIIPHPGSQLNA
jgi:hypothetical protein